MVNDTARLFIGLELPGDVREALSRIARDVPGARWVRPEQLHITLAFLGNVDAARQARLRDALQDVRLTPFALQLRGAGTFGGARPRVLWAGLVEVPAALRRLHADVSAAIQDAGLVADPAPFHPHVTLARLREGRRGDVQPFLDRHATTDFGGWQVTTFVLFRSVLSAQGSTYTVELRA